VTDKTLLAAVRSRLMRSRDGGKNWTMLHRGLVSRVADVQFSSRFSNDRIAYVRNQYGRLLASLDAGDQ
jgi:hypothetical protein